jgi:hypothetical protein
MFPSGDLSVAFVVAVRAYSIPGPLIHMVRSPQDIWHEVNDIVTSQLIV